MLRKSRLGIVLAFVMAMMLALISPVKVYADDPVYDLTINPVTLTADSSVVEGVTIEIKDEAGNVVMTLTSSANPQTVQLPAGKYTVTGTKNGYAITSSEVTVTPSYGRDHTGWNESGQREEVRYHYNNWDKQVEDIVEGTMTARDVYTSEGQPWEAAFCANASLNATEDFPHRYRYLASEAMDTGTVHNQPQWAGATMLDAVVFMNSAEYQSGLSEDMVWGDELIQKMSRVLYYGYPVNALLSDSDKLMVTTQEVVYAIAHHGQNQNDTSYKGHCGGDGDLYDQLLAIAHDSSKTVPSGFKLYAYYTNMHSGTARGQNLIGATMTTPNVSIQAEETVVTPEIKTQVKAAGQTATDSQEVVLSYAEAKALTSFTDTITYSNFEPGTYTIKGTLMKEENGQFVETQFKHSSEVEVTEANGKFEDLEFTGGSLEADTKYVVFEEVVKDGETYAEHKEDVKIQTIKVNPQEENEISIKISKVDLGGKELAGAKIQLKVDGEVVDEWTSTETPHEIILSPGTYVFHEVSAPKGYKVVTDIEFSVQEDGSIKILSSTTDGKVEEGTLIVTDQKDGGNANEVPDTGVKNWTNVWLALVFASAMSLSVLRRKRMN